MSMHIRLSDNSVTVTDRDCPLIQHSGVELLPGADVLLMIDKLPWDVANSKEMLIHKLINLPNDGVMKSLLETLSLFKGPLLITSYMRGTGTHVGYALDFKPILSKDAHQMGLSPMYNARLNLIEGLLEYLNFIVLRNVVILVEENHIHIHAITPEFINLLPPGVYVKPVYSKKYSNDGYTEDLIKLIEGRAGNRIMSGEDFVNNFQDVKFVRRF